MTEQQEKFLNALFGEAQGNFRQAMDIAGYAPTEYPARLIRQMKNEIIERAEYMLAECSQGSSVYVWYPRRS